MSSTVMNKLFYVIILTLVFVLIPSNTLNPRDYNTTSKLPMKDLKVQASTKASALNTTTWFNGETVYITFDNGSVGHYNSTYKYNAINNITHQLSIFIDFPYAPGPGHKNITIYAPLHWNLTILDPVETYVYCSACSAWEFNFTQGGDTTYNITFLSGETYGVDYARQNQYRTIEDPNGYSVENFTSTFDSTTVNTTLRTCNISSLRFVDNTNTAGNATLCLDPGQYYISIWFFLESQNSTTGTLDIQVNNLGTPFLDLEPFEEKKWHRIFFYLEVNTITNSLQFISSTTKECVFFLGCFDIWQSNIAFKNTEVIHQYNVSSSLITHDLYKNFGVYNELVNYSIQIRSNGQSINSTSLTTDIKGYSSYLYYNATLDSTEIEAVFPKEEAAEYYDYNLTEVILLSRFDEGLGIEAFDSSGNEHTGNLVNTPTWTGATADYSDYSLDFELDSSQYINYGDHNDFSFGNGTVDQPFTLSGWIKLESIGVTQTIIAKFTAAGSLEWVLRVDSSNYLRAFCYDSSESAYIGRTANTTLLTTNTWYYVTITYNANHTSEGVKLYVDGELENGIIYETNVYLGMENTTSILTVGARGTGTSPIDGIIDEVVIYNKELSSAEIEAYYNSIAPPEVLTVKTFYQPKPTNHHLFYHQTINSVDEWDFKEGDSDADMFYLSLPEITKTTDNGSMTLSITGSSSSFNYITNYSLPISNALYYDYFSIRIKANEVGLRFRFEEIFANNAVTDIYTITSTNYLVYELPILYNWEDSMTGLQFRVLENDGQGNFDSDEIFDIDYIRLYHEDIPVLYQTMDEYWFLSSQNDSYTYSWTTQNIGTSTITDLTRTAKDSAGGITLTYSAYLDNNYNDSLLLPVEFATDLEFIHLKNTFIADITMALIMVLGFFLIFMTLLFLFRAIFGSIIKKI